MAKLYYYNQTDYPNIAYDNPNTSKKENISTSGCGPVAACIAVNTLAGKELYTVSKMAKLSLSCGARDNSGTNLKTLLDEICFVNKDFKYTTTTDENKVVSHLKSGGMAIVNQGDVYNVFSTAGHFVVAYRMSGSNIEILDPQMYSGKYDSYSRPKRIVKKTSTGCIVSTKELGKATADRNPAYFLISYTPKKKPVYNKGSRYILTADVNLWDSPTTTGKIIGGLKKNTVLSCHGVSTDSPGNIWVKIPSGYVPVYYKDTKRANYYGEIPKYNAGSKYILTAPVNVWTKPTTTSQIKKVGDLTPDGKRNATSKNDGDNATFKKGTVVSCLGVSTDNPGNIWLKVPSGYIPVYYKDTQRANWYNK